MRNLNDMNDLYNVQNVILLLEIVETRFEIMRLKTTTILENTIGQVL